MATLDFKGLLGEATSEPTATTTAAARDNIPPPQQSASESAPAMPQLTREAEENRRDLERARKVYKEYQHNILASGILRSEITKGTNTGEPLELLFLKAVECIAKMTGDSSFYTIIERNVREIYGAGMLEQLPLDMEIKALLRRRDLLAAAYERETETDTREHIKAAYKAVCERAGTLTGAAEKNRGAPPTPSAISDKKP